MSTLEDIKKQLTPEQRAIINAVWEGHKGSSDRWAWMPPAALYRKFTNPGDSRKAGKDFVVSALSSLNGSIIYEHQDHYYGLTLVGVLLSDEAEEGVDLLAQCLGLFQKKHDSGVSLKELSISSQEVKEALNLSDDKLRLLYELINLSRLASANGSSEQWSVSVTYWRDEFLLEDDLRSYVEREILKDYDPTLAVAYEERSRVRQEKEQRGTPSEFSFIRDDNLRHLLEADWKEAQVVHAANAWKSCVILCGSILEGMLFDILSRDEPRTLAAYRSIPNAKRSASGVSDLNLDSLVEVANALKILPPGTFHLSHALRHSRNMVHPEKLLREKVEVTGDDSNIALSSVKKLLQIAATI